MLHTNLRIPVLPVYEPISITNKTQGVKQILKLRPALCTVHRAHKEYTQMRLLMFNGTDSTEKVKRCYSLTNFNSPTNDILKKKKRRDHFGGRQIYVCGRVCISTG
jgi:hypothetical protein